MFLVRKRAAIFLALIVPLSIVGTGIWVHLTVESKFVGETVLFVSICLTLAVAFVSVWALRGSVSVRRVFDRITATRDRSRFTTEFYLRQLGPLGAQIDKLVEETITISEQRQQKLTGSAALIRLLINNSPLPALVTDSTGIIQFVGSAAENKVEEGKNILSGVPVAEIFPDLVFSTLYAELARTGVPVERKARKHNLYAYPVYDASRQITFVVISIGSQARYEEAPAKAPSTNGDPGELTKTGRKAIARVLGGLSRSKGRPVR